MSWAKVVAALFVAGLACGCATQVVAPIPTPGAMPDSQVTAVTPPGFVSFCMRFAGQCDAAPGATSSVVLNDQTWRKLIEGNTKTYHIVLTEDDEAHYGRPEFWTIPTDGYGDCDDYAVTKRKDLLAAGFPAPALRLAIVTTANDMRHAVLTVSTDKGDLVLDNIENNILAWNATGFTWIERQDASNPMNWVSFAGSPAGDTPTASLSISR